MILYYRAGEKLDLGDHVVISYGKMIKGTGWGGSVIKKYEEIVGVELQW